MSRAFPEAAGVRTEWAAVPELIRAAIEERLGTQVVDATTQRGGFSPGLAARCQLANGNRVFLKAADPARNPDTPRFHRSEARISASLPPTVPAPRLLWSLDVDGWAILCFECIDGAQPDVPWVDEQLARVVAAVDDMAVALTPSPINAPCVVDVLGASFRGFDRLRSDLATGRDLSDVDPWVLEHLDELSDLADRWVEGTRGDTLLQCDLRADNILLTDDRVVVVDWPHVCRGAAWFDLLGLLPSVGMQGGSDLDRWFLSTRVGAEADPDAVNAALCGLASYFVHQGREPAPAGIPTVRALQRGQGDAAITWLRQRLGW